jgi:hypothetical protein
MFHNEEPTSLLLQLRLASLDSAACNDLPLRDVIFTRRYPLVPL